MKRYDRAMTVFSPNGHLLQVQYAEEAVKKCSAAVGIRGSDAIVLAVERKLAASMQEGRMERKIVPLDDHVALVFSGLWADARVMILRSQIECQAYRLQVEDSVTIEYIARYIAGIKQLFTQKNGLRPFGLSCIVGGFDYDGSPQLFQTEPSGICHGWKACSTGRCNRKLLEFLQKNYSPETVGTEQRTVKLALRALAKVTPSDLGQRNLEVAVLKRDAPMQMLEADAIKNIVAEIEKEKADKKDKKRNNK